MTLVTRSCPVSVHMSVHLFQFMSHSLVNMTTFSRKTEWLGVLAKYTASSSCTYFLIFAPTVDEK